MKIAQIGALMETRLQSLAEARGRGRKVVGYLAGGFVPDELIYASGAIPLCLSHGGDARSAEQALSLVPNVICPFARAQLGETLLRTNPFYTSLDLVVVPITCQHLKQIGDVWEHYEMVQVFKLGVPYDCQDDYELDYYRDRLAELKKALERLTGNVITDDKLNEAIAVYNRLRGLLKTLSLLRREPQPADQYPRLRPAEPRLDVRRPGHDLRGARGRVRRHRQTGIARPLPFAQETPGAADRARPRLRRLRPHQNDRGRGGRHRGRGDVRGHPRLLAGGRRCRRSARPPREELPARQETGCFCEGGDAQEARFRSRSHRAVRRRWGALVPASLLRNVRRGVVPLREGAARAGHRRCSWSSPTTTTSMPAR